jgi:hypothetical protein
MEFRTKHVGAALAAIRKTANLRFAAKAAPTNNTQAQ